MRPKLVLTFRLFWVNNAHKKKYSCTVWQRCLSNQYCFISWKMKNTFFVILLFLIYCPYFGWADFECLLRKNVTSESLMLSNNSIEALTPKLPDTRNNASLWVLECKCDSDSAVSFFIFPMIFQVNAQNF